MARSLYGFSTTAGVTPVADGVEATVAASVAPGFTLLLLAAAVCALLASAGQGDRRVAGEVVVVVMRSSAQAWRNARVFMGSE
mmetsp:Transcript_12430/g.23805  ORF Transcript_12430/g.23805 Transcript_12430/m.23805 type:complete len:83 (+) Transcript_12430:571-819(+)|eukprot:CAMPEP_0170199574 /NCGR_PEP_ID=MMETSP0040_2-20121228/69412_1 /TAXON_ID=641309 /ORGANISM="Lotharella oceanica, Strain CCMP622" /LENGTH=82 /DNA_ID=CAMNT_0010449707 /DNA_START=563 /DNA_END=811 /DNA_ORIENTATION=-